MSTIDYSEVKRRKQDWIEKAASVSARKVRFTTVSGEPIEMLYTPDDTEEINYLADIGFPGEFPYTRGIRYNMYRGRLWTMRQFAGFGTPEDSNQRFKYLLQRGQTGLSVAFDLPTLMGLDCDDPLSRGEVGICGVAVSSLADMEILFSGIPLDEISTSMTINAPAAVLFAYYLAVAEKQEVPFKRLRGTTQNDILKEYIAQKEWIYPPEASMRIITDMFAYCTKESQSGIQFRFRGTTFVRRVRQRCRSLRSRLPTASRTSKLE